MASGRSGADIAKGTAGSFAPATKDAASDLASKTVGLVTKAEFTRVRAHCVLVSWLVPRCLPTAMRAVGWSLSHCSLLAGSHVVDKGAPSRLVHCRSLPAAPLHPRCGRSSRPHHCLSLLARQSTSQTVY